MSMFQVQIVHATRDIFCEKSCTNNYFVSHSLLENSTSNVISNPQCNLCLTCNKQHSGRLGGLYK